jgi:hypothetical protein
VPPAEQTEQAFPGRQGPWVTAWVELPDLGLQEVTYQEIDGQAVLEGDILLDISGGQTHSALSAGRRKERYRWQDGIIPYAISDSMSEKSQAKLKRAIAHWESKTSLRFVKHKKEKDYVLFRKGSGCSSKVGRQTGEQTVTLGDHCSEGNMIHEIGHVAGLWHEQARADRDKFVSILWANIESGAKDNFDTYIERGEDGIDLGPYDYGSIMHYPSEAFSKNDKPTIKRKDGGDPEELGQRKGLSAGDIRGVESMYSKRVQLRGEVASAHCQSVAEGTIEAGAPMEFAGCNDTQAQEWFFTPRGELRTPLAPGLCLGVAHERTAQGGSVQFRSCNGTTAQQWSNRSGQLRSALDDSLCLSVTHGSTAQEPAAVQLKSCDGTSTQQWTLL